MHRRNSRWRSRSGKPSPDTWRRESAKVERLCPGYLCYAWNDCLVAVCSGGLCAAARPACPRIFSQRWTEPALPLLCLVGLGVAGYLAYVETQAVSAVCGPVGDCNAVQSSPYARLFGFLPIGVLGIAGYLAILYAWLYNRVRDDRIARAMPVGIFGMAILGVIFSLYLTFLEPFVIKAVCIWCITSAVIMTLLMLFSLRPALETIDRQQETDYSHADVEIETKSS